LDLSDIEPPTDSKLSEILDEKLLSDGVLTWEKIGNVSAENVLTPGLLN